MSKIIRWFIKKMNSPVAIEAVPDKEPYVVGVVGKNEATTVTVTELPDLAPPLLPTEQVGPKGWVRNIFFFELPDDYDMDALAAILKTSYSNFKNRTPVAGCELMPMEGKQAGLLQFRHYGDELDDFAVKDLRAEGAFPSFAELKARGFPASELDPKIVCKRGLGGEWPQLGDHMTVTLMQANFIRGGLLLNMFFLHAYCDHTCAYKFTEILAEDVRAAQGIPIPEPVEIPSEDREKIMQVSGNHSDLDLNHHEYIELPFTPTAVPPKLSSPIHHGHVWYLSPENLAALKADASPKNAKLLKGEELPEFISTNDALTALIWRSTMAAQHPAVSNPELIEPGTAGPGGPSQVAIALDARRRAGVPLHKHTIGNILGFAPAILDLDKVVNEASLADLAIIARRAVAKTEGVYLDELTTIIQRLEDVNRLAPTCFLDMPGNHMIQSSWREFPFYDLQWGPAFGNTMQALRPPACGVTHTMQIVLPDPKKGGVEVWVGVESSSMDRLLSDHVWRRYVDAPDGL
ncbi:transferase family-domain-containing protein [Thelonectria olida]|uniref:Transferase family-domain-containing protein n=1 Tax=Thelonectria olida TaxID=1576542 RepID=A0A9P9AU75_9HYPO|nr:transferase family-domain-containing protein [Thelonectria olida]